MATGPRIGFALATTLASIAILSGCGTAPPKRGTDTAQRTAASSPSANPSTATSSRKGGGYYLDDGPGDSPPPNLEFLPDAIPRVEKYASGANRPYNVFGTDYVPDLSGAQYKQRGVGSWYGRKFHGQRTSSGEIYDMYAMTAAHPTLPIPCYALVTNVQNGRSVIVRVNDRGPFLHNRIMDLSYAAAYKVGYLSSGSGMIEVEQLMPADIAAGRIPATTTGLLLAASSPARPDLTIEALTASVPAVAARSRGPVATGPTLPPAPTLQPDAVGRSLPVTPTDPEPAMGVLPDRQPSPALPPIATGAGFYLQLGAFRAKAGADSFAALVSREIDPSLASRVHVSEGSGLYRVRVGPYTQRADADGAADSLRAAVTQPVLVVPDAIRRP